MRINIQNMFLTKFNIHSNFATPPPILDDRAPCSCIECDSLKPAMLVIAVDPIPTVLPSKQAN